MMKALTMAVNQDVSGTNAGKTTETIVKITAGIKGNNPTTIKAVETLPMTVLIYFEII
jgi:hypothetical protein